MIYCEVRNCKRESDIGWRYEGTIGNPRVEICFHHWRLHKSNESDWNLFDEFGYRKPPVKEPRPIKARIEQAETERVPDEKPVYSDKPCSCGKQGFRGNVYCPDCSKEHQRKSGRKSSEKWRALQKCQNG